MLQSLRKILTLTNTLYFFTSQDILYERKNVTWMNNGKQQRMPIRKTRYLNGFTVVEMLITLSVLVILTGIAIPVGRKTIDYMRLKTTGDQIKLVLKVAQSKATADPQVHCGVYMFPGTGASSDYANKQFAIFFDKDNDYTYDTVTDPLYLGARSLPPGITLSIPPKGGITNNVIVFRGDGSAKTGGSIILTSKYARKDSINVLPSTGRIKTFIK